MGVRRKAIAILLLLVFLLAVTSAVATAAKKLEVQKLVDYGNNKEIKVGDEVIISLKFKNPFNREIPVRIVDRNVFGDNGLDIKCLEYALPAKEESILTYSEPIVPFKPGKYTLDAAKVTYTNPETGKRETVESNTLDLEVKANNTLPQRQAQGITTIYHCNGTNIHSTSYSSYGSSFNIQIGRSSSYGNEQQQSGGQQQKGVEKRVTNNQISQNTGQLKKELEKEMQRQKEESWWLLLLIPIAVVIATGWFIFGRYLKIKRAQRQETSLFAMEQVASADYASEARRMVEEAERLFRNNREKDAYERISQALRFYFSHKQGIKKELLKTELMETLRGKVDADLYSKVRDCLDWCEKVEFAKYRPNEKDFDKIVGVTKEIIT